MAIPTLGNPSLIILTLRNITLDNPTLGNPTLGNPSLGNPTLGNQSNGLLFTYYVNSRSVNSPVHMFWLKGFLQWTLFFLQT